MATPLEILGYKSENQNKFYNWVDSVSSNSVIIGGGGLLNRRSFEKPLKIIQKLPSKGKKSVLWGIGHNSPYEKDFRSSLKYNIDVSQFGLIGLRDYSAKENWVPCVSCMHSAFDRSYDETREVGIVLHQYLNRKKHLPAKLAGFPHIDNSVSMEEMIAFLGSTGVVITDSYHAMYWAMLLEKKVLVIPKSSKFFDFKYDPVFTTFDTALNDIKKAKAVTGILEECRDINIRFSKKVIDYIYS